MPVDGQKTVIIADGAAYGSQMEDTMESMRACGGYTLYLPESFEYLIIRSGIVAEVIENYEDIVYHTYDYADSGKYFSWERYFTDLSTKKTIDTEWKYGKNRLNSIYKLVRNMRAILESITGIDFDR